MADLLLVDPHRGDGVLGVALRGTGWSMGSAMATRGLSFLVTLAVARAFEPAGFGLMAVCWTVHNAAVLLRDQAVTSTIVVAHDSRTLRNTVFLLNVAMSIALALCVVGVGSPISSLVGLDARPLLVLFGAAFFASALGSVPSGLLQRSLQFKALAIIELVAAGTYVFTTIVLIAADFGPEAVGWGQLAGATVGAVGVWVVSGFRPTREFSLRAFRRVANYSGGTAAIAGLAFAFVNIDTLWVAAQGNASQLGQYTLAFNVAFVFAMTLGQVVQKVAFSTHASFEREGRSGRRLLVESERLILAVSLPVSWALILFGPELLDRVFGSDYHGATAPLRILAIYGVLASFAAPAVSLLRAQSHLGIVLRSLGLQLVLAAVGLPFAIKAFGTAGAAATVTVALAAGTLMVLVAAFKSADVGVDEVGHILPGPAATLGLLVPLICLGAIGQTPTTYWVGLGGMVVYAIAFIGRERRLRRPDGPSLLRTAPVRRLSVVLAVIAGAGAVGALAAVAPPTAIVGGCVCVLAWIASSRMRQAALVAIALAPVLPIGLFVDMGPSLPLVTAARGLVATLVLAALLALVRGRLHVRRWSVWGAFALWLFAVAASVPGSIDVAASRLRLMSELFETAAFSGIIYCVFDRSTYRQVLRVLTVGAAVGAALAIMQVLKIDLLAGIRARAASVTGRGNPLIDTADARLGFARAQGAFQTPSFLGASMALALPVAYALMLTERRDLRRWWALCTALIAGGLVASVTRAAWLVAAAALLWVIAAGARRSYPVARHLYLAAAVSVTGAWLLPRFTGQLVGLIGSILDTRADASTSTTNYRLFLNDQVLAVASHRPWTGFGAGTFDRIGITGVNEGLVVKLTSADSHALRLLAEVGRLGAAAFGILMVTVLVTLWGRRVSASARDQVLLTAVIGAAIGYLLMNLTISAFAIAQPTFFFWAMVAGASACGSEGCVSNRSLLTPAAVDLELVGT